MSKAELVYGRHAVAGVIKRDLWRVREVWVQAERRDAPSAELAEIAAAAGIAVHRLPRKAMDRMVDGAPHQGIIIRYRPPSTSQAAPDWDALAAGLSGPPFLLGLDGVQDPHNLGACLRTASAVGVHAVVVPRRHSVGLTPAVRKVACGAAETVPLLQVPNLAQALRRLRERGIQVVGTAADAGMSLYQTDLRGPLAMIMGGEEHGLRRLTREHCDLLVRIPMQGPMESLNLSVAAAVCLYEACRQRGGPC